MIPKKNLESIQNQNYLTANQLSANNQKQIN